MKLFVLPILALAQKVVKYTWAITEITDAPDGFERKALGINNTPGYMNTVEANEGDTIQVTVTNKLAVPSAIHWHGMYQNGTLEADGPVGITQCAIQPGKTYIYRFEASRVGTFWWHAHFGPEYVDGLRGPLIIHMKNEPYINDYDYDYTIQLTDWYHESADVLAANYLNPTLNPSGNEPVWSAGLINGNGRYNCTATESANCNNNHPLSQFTFKAGKRYRLRFINMAAFATFNVSIADHSMRVIEVDGTVADGKQQGTSLFINVAQRYSVIVVADQKPKQYVLSAIMLDNSPFTSLPVDQEDAGLVKTSIALINYQSCGRLGKEYPVHQLQDIDTTAVAPLDPQTIPEPTRKVNFEFIFQNTDSDPVNRAYVSFDGLKTNNTYSFPTGTPTIVDVVQNKVLTKDLPANLNAVEINHGEVIDIVIISHDGGEHPLHLHGHDFWIMGKGTADSNDKIPTSFDIADPVKRDTVTVPSCNTDANGACIGVAWTVLRFVADNPGIWIFHCHIDWHLIAGLGMTFIESPKVLQARGLNPATLAVCAN